VSQRTTVVLLSAGVGSRLGWGRCKALVEVGGRSLLEWQLRSIPSDVDVRVGTGFQANEVRAVVQAVRPSARTVHNPDFACSGPAQTLHMASAGLSGRVVSWSGDVLVHPHDLRRVLAAERNIVTVTDVHTSTPIYAAVDPTGPVSKVTSLSPAADMTTPWEWACMANLAVEMVVTQHHPAVFQMLATFLPMEAIFVRSRELDRPADLASLAALVSEIAPLIA